MLKQQDKYLTLTPFVVAQQKQAIIDGSTVGAKIKKRGGHLSKENATREVLTQWTERLRAETGEGFPEQVTAFREGMAVHGRYRKPCPVCGAPVQRIVYAENETNYCARCQTGGRLLADRAMSRLLKEDWPKTLEELEEG